MIRPRSALKFDLFAGTSRKRKIDEVGDPLQTIAQHIELAALVDGLLARTDGRKGGRPAYPTEVMVRVLILKRLYNLSDEQMEYQLLDRMSYQQRAGHRRHAGASTTPAHRQGQQRALSARPRARLE